MYAVMWSEHCSYKSSRIHLRRLPTEGTDVLVGPGENAGVVDVGDGIAVAFRIESHNHPSAIEPYQGAATGIGGILRDVFTMGARPDRAHGPAALRPAGRRPQPVDRRRCRVRHQRLWQLGRRAHRRRRDRLRRDLSGQPARQRVLPRASCPSSGWCSGGRRVSATWPCCSARPPGATASAACRCWRRPASATTSDDAAKRPSVQVGDPFEEKRLIEACLEMLDAGLVVGIQDLGGAGLTCATSETASRGGVGMDVYVSEVPQREAGMEPFEVMTSESQERMLAIVEPGDLDEVLAICARWEITAAVVGTVTAGGRLRILDRLDGEVLADVPASSLHEDAPLLDRPRAEPADRAARLADSADAALGAARRRRRPTCSTCSTTRRGCSPVRPPAVPQHGRGPGRRRHACCGSSTRPPGVDTGRALALTCDGNHRWCALDPRQGTALVVAEAVANLACVGARPLALVNCLNFGNPEHPEMMWQLSEAVDGMAEACRALSAAGRGRQRQPLQREPRPRHRPHARRRRGRHDRPPGGPAPGRAAWSTGTRLVVLGAEPDTLSGSRWAWRRGHKSGRAAGARPRGPPRRVRPGPRPGRRRAACWACTTPPTAARAWRWPRWRWPAGVGAVVRAPDGRRPPLAVRRVAQPVRAGGRPGRARRGRTGGTPRPAWRPRGGRGRRRPPHDQRPGRRRRRRRAGGRRRRRVAGRACPTCSATAPPRADRRLTISSRFVAGAGTGEPAAASGRSGGGLGRCPTAVCVRAVRRVRGAARGSAARRRCRRAPGRRPGRPRPRRWRRRAGGRGRSST